MLIDSLFPKKKQAKDDLHVPEKFAQIHDAEKKQLAKALCQHSFFADRAFVRRLDVAANNRAMHDDKTIQVWI